MPDDWDAAVYHQRPGQGGGPVNLGGLMAEREELLRLAATIVSAHSSNNPLPADQLPVLIQQVFNTLATVEQKAVAPPRPEPAV